MERLESPECYFTALRDELRLKRDMLAESLAEAGLNPIVPDGAYYMVADISKFDHGEKFSTSAHMFRDHKFVKHLIERHVSFSLIRIESK